ncbi:MAG TPA: hypothetical protein VLT13_01355 [Bacteroidota bacterium]|nr:hypothetical protein [Bacteroidota bacterium]
MISEVRCCTKRLQETLLQQVFGKVVGRYLATDMRQQLFSVDQKVLYEGIVIHWAWYHESD